MNVVAWARVSSREQKEGYSIDAQLRAMRDKSQRENVNIVREFVVAESAKRGAERLAFNDMLRWVKANAKKERIGTILSHKLDRVCRNMRDAVRLQELEDASGVQLSFVENQFGPGAAGVLSFNVMAAVAQYYSDNLRSEVLKGMEEKVRQGWPTGTAPYGYMNVKDRNEPVQPHPEKSFTVIRVFQLYSQGNRTFKALADKLAEEGHIYQPSQPRFHRTALSYILNNRFYIGEIRHRGQWFPGKHRPLVDRTMFDLCQQILSGKNRRFSDLNHALAGGLFRCAYCGQSITGERIRRRLRGGGVREHLYYRCANNCPDESHPTVRWKAEDLERAIVNDLARLRIPSPEVTQWFRTALQEAFADITVTQKRQAGALAKRQTELRAMQDRLLNAYLSGTVDEGTFGTKSTELRDEMARVQESIERLGNIDPRAGEAVLAVFDWSQNAAETWRGSNNPLRREILESVCLNRTLSDVSLVTTKRKPFDVLAERLNFNDSRGDRI